MNKKIAVVVILLALLMIGLLTVMLLWSKEKSVEKIETEEQAINYLKKSFPEFQEYPSDNLPPKSIKTEKGDEGWYIAFIQNGSGKPIINARCFLVKPNSTTIETGFIASNDDINTEFSVKECTNTSEGTNIIVGGDSDEHGCKASAGYSWCEAKNKCLRIWEEPCTENVDNKDNDGNATTQDCNVENCHGLDIKCGKNLPELCTEIYELGDKCLGYATCGNVNGKCVQVENSKFTNCKSCVEKCKLEFPDDPEKLFGCESEC